MISYLEEAERQEAKEMVMSFMGCPLPEPYGAFIAVKLFVNESHIQKIGERELIVPPSASCRDRTRPHPALVIGKGERATTPYHVGDFIVIPRHQGIELSWYGHRVRFLEGDNVYSTLKEGEGFSLEREERDVFVQ